MEKRIFNNYKTIDNFSFVIPTDCNREQSAAGGRSGGISRSLRLCSGQAPRLHKAMNTGFTLGQIFAYSSW